MKLFPFLKVIATKKSFNSYDNYEELDLEHINIAMKNFAYFISFWYNGQAATKEDFDRVKVFMDIDLNASDNSDNAEKQAKEKQVEAEEALKDIEEAEEAENKVLKAEDIIQPEENSEPQGDSEAAEDNSEPNPDENQ